MCHLVKKNRLCGGKTYKCILLEGGYPVPPPPTHTHTTKFIYIYKPAHTMVMVRHIRHRCRNSSLVGGATKPCPLIQTLEDVASKGTICLAPGNLDGAQKVVNLF